MPKTLYGYQIGTNLQESDVLGGLRAVPDNRSLFIMALGDKHDKEVEPVRLKNLKEVFEHYQPNRVVELIDGNGEKLKERLNFHSLHDFSIERIVEQIEMLQTQEGSLLSENLSTIFLSIRDLEISYSALHLFFENAIDENTRNLYFLNIPIKILNDPDNQVIGDLEYLFEESFDRFSFEDNYGLMIVPGFLGDGLKKMSELAAKYMITLVTDFLDIKEVEDFEDYVEENPLGGDEIYLAHTIMTFNYGLIRRKYNHKNIIEEDLYVPLSPALAGRIYSGDGIQPAAGRKHGKLEGLKDMRLKILRSQADKVDRSGLIPIIHEPAWGVVAMSDVTLCSFSSNPDLRAIGVVRSISWINKVILDYLNGISFLSFNSKIQDEIDRKLKNFFKRFSGYGGLFQDYYFKANSDPNNPQILHLSLNIKPYFATKHVTLEFSGPIGRIKIQDTYLR